MTNLEYYKEIVKQMLDESNCCLCDYIPSIKEYKDCVGCPYFRDKKSDIYECDMPKFVDWLSQEHKEPIKLKKWEYDFFKIYNDVICGDFKIIDITLVINLKEKGHFKGVKDTSMSIQKILDNCEVVDD